MGRAGKAPRRWAGKTLPTPGEAAPAALEADEIRRAEAHPARLRSAMGEIASQKIVFLGGQFVADPIGRAGADERIGKEREYLPGFLE